MTTQPDSPPAQKPSLIIFLGGLGATPVERMVAEARTAATLDTIEAARSTGTFARAILATDSSVELPSVPDLEVDLDDAPFRFGPRLAGPIGRHNLDRVVYLGGGSLPLLDTPALVEIAQHIHPTTAITNNAFSSDLIAFPVTDAVLKTIPTVERDNTLARALEDSAGLTLEELRRTVATQMDIDTPTDLAILALTGEGGPRLRDYLRELNPSLSPSPAHGREPALSGRPGAGEDTKGGRGVRDLDLSRYERVLPLLTDRQAQIVVAGRVGSHAWRYLERETACRVRLFAEERGLEAEGRAEERTARSLLGFYIEAAGLDRFVEVLPQLGDAAFIDTRVLLAHMRIDATREDRFLSDLGQWSDIHDPFLRDLTRAATEAPIPVLLGGHSLMSGGLMALNEHAWRQHEANP